MMGDGVPQMQTGPMYLGVYVSEEQFVLLTEALLRARGEKGIGAFRLSLKPPPLIQRWIVKCRHFQISGKAYSFLMRLILNHVLKVMII